MCNCKPNQDRKAKLVFVELPEDDYHFIYNIMGNTLANVIELMKQGKVEVPQEMHSLQVGDLICFGHFRDACTFIVSKNLSLIQNPDHGGEGYLSIPVAVTTELEDPQAFYEDLAICTLELSLEKFYEKYLTEREKKQCEQGYANFMRARKGERGEGEEKKEVANEEEGEAEMGGNEEAVQVNFVYQHEIFEFARTGAVGENFGRSAEEMEKFADNPKLYHKTASKNFFTVLELGSQRKKIDALGDVKTAIISFLKEWCE